MITLKKTVHNLTFLLASILLVSIFTACSKPMNACFTYSPTTAITTSTNIVFNVSCSENVSSYRWAFGDGTQDITTTSLTISHKYNTAGTYTITLNAERKDGVSIKKGKPTQEQTIRVQ